jgi:endonuclease YncB( thermonuclease family)
MGYDGQITRVIDGDTLLIDQTTIRLSLVNSPERDERGYQEAKDFALTVCPIGINAEFIEDSLQPKDKYGRSVGLVYCNDMMLNELLLTNGHAEISTYFCDKSEFGSEGWARAYGC